MTCVWTVKMFLAQTLSSPLVTVFPFKDFLFSPIQVVRLFKENNVAYLMGTQVYGDDILQRF